jgi:transglutaminase superfamily protein
MRLAEAALLYAFVAAALRTVAYARLQRWLERFTPVPRRTRSSVSDVTGAISAVGRRIGGTTCLTEAAVAYTMLRRHGHDPRLRIGVRRGDAALDAHAWVECDGTVVMGELPEMTGYAMLG